MFLIRVGVAPFAQALPMICLLVYPCAASSRRQWMSPGTEAVITSKTESSTISARSEPVRGAATEVASMSSCGVLFIGAPSVAHVSVRLLACGSPYIPQPAHVASVSQVSDQSLGHWVFTEPDRCIVNPAAILLPLSLRPSLVVFLENFISQGVKEASNGQQYYERSGAPKDDFGYV